MLVYILIARAGNSVQQARACVYRGPLTPPPLGHPRPPLWTSILCSPGYASSRGEFHFVSYMSVSRPARSRRPIRGMKWKFDIISGLSIFSALSPHDILNAAHRIYFIFQTDVFSAFLSRVCTIQSIRRRRHASVPRDMKF